MFCWTDPEDLKSSSFLFLSRTSSDVSAPASGGGFKVDSKQIHQNENVQTCHLKYLDKKDIGWKNLDNLQTFKLSLFGQSRLSSQVSVKVVV